MTQSEQQAKFRMIQEELLSMIQEKFPLVELMELEERSGSSFALHLYAPYEDKIEIWDQVASRVADLVDQGIYVRILPHGYRFSDRAA